MKTRKYEFALKKIELFGFPKSFCECIPPDKAVYNKEFPEHSVDKKILTVLMLSEHMHVHMFGSTYTRFGLFI